LDVGQMVLYPMPHYAGLEAANPDVVWDVS